MSTGRTAESGSGILALLSIIGILWFGLDNHTLPAVLAGAALAAAIAGFTVAAVAKRVANSPSIAASSARGLLVLFWLFVIVSVVCLIFSVTSFSSGH